MTAPRNLTIIQASDLIKRRLLSPVDLAIDLLKVSQDHEDMLRVWSYMDPSKTLHMARICEQEIESGKYKGPMHGIPIGIKDIYFTEDMKTTCGSPIYENFYSDYDAQTVKILRSNGAIIMGKTITTQFACGDPPVTKNPWNSDRTPGGSSSGSAVGVAARFFPAALGSQTAGSVLRPAAYNGIVGFKPTYGLISKSGVYPVAPSLDTVGWLTRCVSDARILFQNLVEFNSKTEDSTKSNDTNVKAEYLENKNIRLGIVNQYYPDMVDPESGKSFESLVSLLTSKGVNCETSNLDVDFDEILASHGAIMSSEAAHTHSKDFSIRPEDYAVNVKQLIKTGLETSALNYLAAKKVQNDIKSKLSDILLIYDALITPTSISGAPSKTTTGQPTFQAPWTFSGNPTINLPYTLDSDGLPIGVQIIGRHLEEMKLLCIAEYLETIICFDAHPTLTIKSNQNL